jgi:ribosomal protein S27AE
MAMFHENERFSCEKCGNSDRFSFKRETRHTLRKDLTNRVARPGESKDVYVCTKCSHYFDVDKNIDG